MGFEPMTLYTLGECCLVDYVNSIIFFWNNTHFCVKELA